MKLMKTIYLFFLLLVIPGGLVVASPALEKARGLFYQAVEDDAFIDPAISLFETLDSSGAVDPGLATTYIGALEALRGKHAMLPIDKYRRTLKGLEILDRGVAINPENLESRFIRGTTCYFLPFFFERKMTVQEDFDQMVNLISVDFRAYEPGLVLNVVGFLRQHAELSPDQLAILDTIEAQTN
jgi:hypothetical protein